YMMTDPRQTLLNPLAPQLVSDATRQWLQSYYVQSQSLKASVHALRTEHSDDNSIGRHYFVSQHFHGAVRLRLSHSDSKTNILESLARNNPHTSRLSPIQPLQHQGILHKYSACDSPYLPRIY